MSSFTERLQSAVPFDGEDEDHAFRRAAYQKHLHDPAMPWNRIREVDEVEDLAERRLAEVERHIRLLSAERDVLRRIVPSQVNAKIIAYLTEHGPSSYPFIANAVGSRNPAAILTRLHRLQGVRQTAPKSGVWEISND